MALAEIKVTLDIPVIETEVVPIARRPGSIAPVLIEAEEV
jgi:hypothetical protein